MIVKSACLAYFGDRVNPVLHILYIKCNVNVKDINRNNRHKWIFINLDSAIRPHSEKIPTPMFSSLPTLSRDNVGTSSYELHSNRNEESKTDFKGDWTRPERFTQEELKDYMTKGSSEMLAFRLTKVTFYRIRKRIAWSFFSGR